ncbi:MAG: hypothetical protein JRH16_09765 [Deltaproteobacteria bacterium]|nr:hypothetical protein [Deltaproteobacteria bacterium]MBW2361141.1 hypothetical protein [Deltaproteobacteria bacterium]
MAQSFFDPARHKWRKVTGDPGLSYKVSHEYTILGHDLAAGTLDMVVRWEGDGGHCPVHRHIATTTVLVFEGEQHLWDIHPDGTRAEPKVRCAGDYALTVDAPLPHLERGGDEGGIAFFGCHASDGILYELYDEDMKPVMDVTIETLIADWNANA